MRRLPYPNLGVGPYVWMIVQLATFQLGQNLVMTVAEHTLVMLVRMYVIHLLETYVTILRNWLIL